MTTREKTINILIEKGLIKNPEKYIISDDDIIKDEKERDEIRQILSKVSEEEMQQAIKAEKGYGN